MHFKFNCFFDFNLIPSFFSGTSAVANNEVLERQLRFIDEDKSTSRQTRIIVSPRLIFTENEISLNQQQLEVSSFVYFSSSGIITTAQMDNINRMTY